MHLINFKHEMDTRNKEAGATIYINVSSLGGNLFQDPNVTISSSGGELFQDPNVNFSSPGGEFLRILILTSLRWEVEVLVLVTDIKEKDTKRSQKNKTEHGIEKSIKRRSQPKSKSKSTPSKSQGIGIGVVLQQEGHHVAYLSKTLAPKHQSLSAYKKELLAVIMALDRCRGIYLLDRHFQIKTNHFSLKYFLDQRITTPFQSKWLPKLLGFDYEIMYKRGKENDALSRTAHGGELAIEEKRQAYGIVATTQRLGKWFYWKGLRKTVKKLVIQCDVYQRNKADLAAYPGLLQPLPIPQRGLGLPNTIVSDRDKVFTSLFWKSLFQMLKGKDLRKALSGYPWVEEVDRTLVAREQVIQLLEFHLKRAQNKMKSMADKHTSDREFNEGDWVYLKLQPYRQVTVRQSAQHKISTKYYGPFRVLKKIGKVAYKLELQSIAQVNDVVHVSQLKKCKEEVVTTMGSFPQCRDDGLIDVTPMAVLDRRMMKKKNRVVV
ncbi:putative mitochondrial protein, partial [Tanacetum coccineum]